MPSRDTGPTPSTFFGVVVVIFRFVSSMIVVVVLLLLLLLMPFVSLVSLKSRLME